MTNNLAEVLRKCEVVVSRTQEPERFLAEKNSIKDWKEVSQSLSMTVWQSGSFVMIKYHNHETIYRVKQYEQLRLF